MITHELNKLLCNMWTGVRIIEDNCIDKNIHIIKCQCNNDNFTNTSHMKDCIKTSIRAYKRRINIQNINTIRLNKNEKENEFTTEFKIIVVKI